MGVDSEAALGETIRAVGIEVWRLGGRLDGCGAASGNVEIMIEVVEVGLSVPKAVSQAEHLWEHLRQHLSGASCGRSAGPHAVPDLRDGAEASGTRVDGWKPSLLYVLCDRM